ncbi:MAG: hypothetical protein IT443_05090 [Phycisphaeraceae bacterium]|nr:hypothetical protein [Phycisphaeraceae bacterium]
MSLRSTLKFFTTTLPLLAVVVLLLAGGYYFLSYRIAADIYRERLKEVVRQRDELRLLYNEAVRRTAVTELIVAEGKLSVAIRMLDGAEKIIPTPFDPSGEIYVDFAVRDNRLWIRRIFDARTPPLQGIVIDPELGKVDWDAPGHAYGKAVYRSLSQGRWVVTVTGDGSLGLAKRLEGESADLVPAPAVKDYPQIEQEIQGELETISPLDVLERMLHLPSR